MCQVVNACRITPRCNTQVSRLLIAAGIFLLVALQSVQSMPSRASRQFDVSSSESHQAKDSFEDFENPTLPRRNNGQGRDEPRGDPRDLSKGKTTPNPDAIQYPGDWEPNQRNFIPQPMDSCRGKTFCEEAPAYPQDYVSNIISRTDSLKFFSAVDRIEVSERVGSSDGGEVLCGSEVSVVYPKTAQNEDKEWRFIVQDEKAGFKQGVKVENCDVGTTGNSCKIIEGSIFGYKTSCKQKYVARVMATLHPNGNAITENFKIPSSCCCQIKLIGDGVGARIGGINPKNQSPAPTIKSGRNH